MNLPAIDAHMAKLGCGTLGMSSLDAHGKYDQQQNTPKRYAPYGPYVNNPPPAAGGSMDFHGFSICEFTGTAVLTRDISRELLCGQETVSSSSFHMLPRHQRC